MSTPEKTYRVVLFVGDGAYRIYHHATEPRTSEHGRLFFITARYLLEEE